MPGYKAPELIGLTGWINSDPILSLAQLQGKVVLLEFWTAGCINCINTHKETQKLYQEFQNDDFTVLGIHAPEFAYERKVEEVQKAVEKYNMTFPVAQDNDFSTWKAYNNKYWPAFYLIDHNGQVRYTHFGEGGYEDKREKIMKLIDERNKLDYPSLHGREGAGKADGMEEKPEYAFQRAGLKTNTAKSAIDLSQVLDGGPGKDGIPAINDPKFYSHSEVARQAPYLGEDDLGLVLVDKENNARFYGYDVLVWHEIVNDTFAGKKISVTFCPLCGSGIVYERVMNGEEVDFGVSGRLYNSNLLMYDSQTESLWSQSEGRALIGDFLGRELTIVDADLMNYSEYKEAFPNGEVLSNRTGYFRRYGEIPYGNYDESDALYFPVAGNEDVRHHPKKLFYVVRDEDSVLGFPWEELRQSGETKLSHNTITYTARFDSGLASVTSSVANEKLPGYFEMWFSLVATHGDTLILP